MRPLTRFTRDGRRHPHWRDPSLLRYLDRSAFETTRVGFVALWQRELGHLAPWAVKLEEPLHKNNMPKAPKCPKAQMYNKSKKPTTFYTHPLQRESRGKLRAR